jgi:hypothetical protein
MSGGWVCGVGGTARPAAGTFGLVPCALVAEGRRARAAAGRRAFAGGGPEAEAEEHEAAPGAGWTFLAAGGLRFGTARGGGRDEWRRGP